MICDVEEENVMLDKSSRNDLKQRSDKGLCTFLQAFSGNFVPSIRRSDKEVSKTIVSRY